MTARTPTRPRPRAGDELVVELEEGPGGGTTLIAHGVGPLTVRRAFASLRD